MSKIVREKDEVSLPPIIIYFKYLKPSYTMSIEKNITENGWEFRNTQFFDK